MSSPEPQLQPSKSPRRVSPAVSFGVNFAAGMALCSYMGWRLDQRRGGGRIGFTLAGMVLGLVYGAYEVWKIVRAAAPREGGPVAPPQPPGGKEARP